MFKTLLKGLLATSLFSFSSPYNPETAIKERIMENYSASCLPKADGINMELGIAFRSFNNIDQIAGTVESNIWLRYYWHDDRLKWDYNKTQINDVIYSTEPGSEWSIWTPDIYLYNTAEQPMVELQYSRAIVHYNGDIIWSRPGIIRSTCVFDLRYFPYDMQTCHFKFGSWVYPKSSINLRIYSVPIDMSNYMENEGWDVINTSYELEVKKYACCPEEYPSAMFNITFLRKSGYYDINIIVPTFATATLMVISMLIPWNSGERISFAATVMLSIIVFLLILSDNLPKTDTKPLLSIMLVGLMFFSLGVVFFTVLITAMRNMEDNNIFVRLVNKFRNRKLRRNSSYRKAIELEREREKPYIEILANKMEIFFTVLFMIAFAVFSITAVSLRPDHLFSVIS
jgi:hypothetical protein